MEKLFYEMQGKHSSSGAKQCEIARHALTLAGYKWAVARVRVDSRKSSMVAAFPLGCSAETTYP